MIEVELEATKAAKDQLQIRISKWRCPECKQWVREDFGKACKSCKGKRSAVSLTPTETKIAEQTPLPAKKVPAVVPEPRKVTTVAKEKSLDYKGLDDKIADQEASKARLTEQLNAAPEDQKPELQKQLAEADRKIRWYQGRKANPRFAAKEAKFAALREAARQAALNPPASEEAPAPAASPTQPAGVVNES